MKKLIYLMFITAVALGCSIDALENSENIESADVKAKKVQDQEVSSTVYEGPGNAEFRKDNGNNQYKGYISVSNDCDNLYVEIVSAEDAIEDVHLGFFQGDFFPKDNGPESDLVEYSDQASFTFPLSDFVTSQELRIFAKAFGTFAGSESWGKHASYFTYTFEEVECEEVCVGGKGYWWNHGPNGNPGNQENAWPEEVMDLGLHLGNNKYTAEQLGKIYDKNTSGGNGLVSVAHHLITTKLNLSKGADPTDVAAAVELADEFIGTANPLEDYKPQSEVGNFKDVLENYNEGLLGPDKCEEL